VAIKALGSVGEFQLWQKYGENNRPVQDAGKKNDQRPHKPVALSAKFG